MEPQKRKKKQNPKKGSVKLLRRNRLILLEELNNQYPALVCMCKVVPTYGHIRVLSQPLK